MSQDLIKQLEAATGGDRELDAKIALSLLNIKVATHGYFYTDQNNTVIFPEEIAAYTASIDAAVALAERVLPNERPRLDRIQFDVSKQWRASMTGNHISWAPTPALALCIAILKAKEAQDAQ